MSSDDLTNAIIFQNTYFGNDFFKGKIGFFVSSIEIAY